MLSKADKETEKRLKKLEKKIAEVYRSAYIESHTKLDEYFAQYEKRWMKQFQAYQAGRYTKQQWDAWQMAQLGRGEAWAKQVDDLALRIEKANDVASAYINDTTPGIYSLNANFTAYTISQYDEDIAWNIYDENTVRRLMEDENHTNFRVVHPDKKRNYSWNSDKINKALISGIIQGKGIHQLADSFMPVMKRNRTAAIRNARTSVTSAQNGGRVDTFSRAEAGGIEIKKEWMSTLDYRTRDSHRHLDGERVANNAKFSNGLMYPGDPAGPGREVYNCRCTLVPYMPEIDLEPQRETYSEWENRMQKQNVVSTSENESYIIKLNDIQIMKSVGAKARNYEIIDPDTGEIFNFVEGTKIQDAEVFAGKGVSKKLMKEVAEGLSEQIGGKPEDWQHCKGTGTIDYYGEYVKADVHWFQEKNCGKFKFKIKRWKFDE